MTQDHLPPTRFPIKTPVPSSWPKWLDCRRLRPRACTALQVLFLLALPLLLTGCDAEQWFAERMVAAQSLSPSAIAAFLFGGGFVSEDLACVSGGVLVSKGSLSYVLAAVACTLGVWTSDSVLYFWGVLGRRGLLERAPLRWIVKRAQIERGAGLFRNHGAKILILSRFMPGSRVALYLAAGALRYPYHRFAAWMGLAAVVWAPVMVWLSLKLGDALLGWLEAYERIAWIAVPLVVLLIWLVMRGIEWVVVKRTGTIIGESVVESLEDLADPEAESGEEGAGRDL